MVFHEKKELEKEIAERKQAEDDLRRSEERYRELSEFLPIAIFETDNKGDIIYANKSAFQLTGYTQKNIDDGINIMQIIASQDQDRALRMSQQVMQNRLTDGAEYLITKKDGSTCPGFINTRPTKKTTPGLIGYIFDMTGLKDVERALRKSEEKYKDILESIEDGYYEVDLSGNFTFFNDSMRRILGYPADELLGMNNREYMDAENAKKIFQTFNEVYRTGISTKALDWKLIRKDGSTCFIETVVSLIKDSNNDKVGFRGIARDVTEQKQARDSLKESEEKHKAIFENSLDCIFLHDFEGNFIDANPAALNLLEYTREEISTVNLLKLLDKEGRQKTAKDLKVMLQEGSNEKPSEYKIKKKDGDFLYIETKGSIIYQKGRPFAVMGTARDITERKRTEQQLLRSEKLAALGNMVAGVAHEISTPLGVGLMSASFLQDKTHQFIELCSSGVAAPSEVEKYAKKAIEASSMVLSNLSRAAELLNSFKHVAIDQIVEKKRNFNLKTNIKETLSSLSPKYKRTAHTITVECPDDLEIDSYPGAFSQIITNLFLNSLEHGFDGIEKGEIILKADKKENMLLFTYRDTGKGMDKPTLNKLFDPFFTTARSKGGTGLGMHIVYNLVSQTLKGQIECGSSLGKGTEFEIKIPL